MKKITFMGAIACLAVSLTLLSSCKKEEITSKKTSLQSENTVPKSPDYKFTTDVKMYGEKAEDGFLTLKISSNDEAFLAKYVKQYEGANILFREADPTKEERPASNEEKSEAGVSIHFDWSNYHFNLEKGKMYGLSMKPKDGSKALVHLLTTANMSSFTTSNPLACVNLLNTYNSWNINCTCYPDVRWSFYSSQTTTTEFWHQTMDPGSNFEIRTFSGYSSNTYWSFTVGGNTLYFQPRYNYTGTLITGTLTDYNAIYKGDNYLEQLPGLKNYGRATATFYVAG